MDVEACLARFRTLFEQAGEPGEAWSAFEAMYRRYRGGVSGTVEWATVGPTEEGDLAPLEGLTGGAASGSRWGRLAWIVLNGGLGTSMRMARAKSLLPVKGSRTFLDLLADHAGLLRKRHGVDLPVVFMDSFATRDDTLAALAAHPELVRDGLPLDFMQHRFPRIREADGLPLGDGGDRDHWAPPGHGNLYPALASSGILEALLRRGVRWAFVSNADNMGASPHPAILDYLAERDLSFLMEVTPKTAADVKGGTLVRRLGRLELLEIAQVPPHHVADFQDTSMFPVFNTNNLWIDLAAVGDRLAGGGLDLPLIVNRKVVGEAPVVQLETAMGAAVGAFDRTAGVLVGRDRFAPVKTTDDLVVRRSNLYMPGDRAPLVLHPDRDPTAPPPVVRLDPRFFKAVPDLDVRIPAPLDLVEATGLEVVGDVRFGRDVKVRGAVRVENLGSPPLQIPDGTCLEGGGDDPSGPVLRPTPSHRRKE